MSNYFQRVESHMESEKLAIICPKCYTLNGIIESDKSTKIEVLEDSDISIQQSTIFDIVGTCKKCGEEVEFFTVDHNINMIIRILNEKGYKTRFCCGGHGSEDLLFFSHSTQPYIFFKSIRYLPFLKPLPDGWEIDKEDLTDNMLIMRTHYIKFDSLELYDWVLKLPEVTDEMISFVSDKDILEEE